MQTLYSPAAAVPPSGSRPFQIRQQCCISSQCREFSTKDTPSSPLEAETQAAEDAGNISGEEADPEEASLQKMIEEKDQMVWCPT